MYLAVLKYRTGDHREQEATEQMFNGLRLCRGTGLGLFRSLPDVGCDAQFCCLPTKKMDGEEEISHFSIVQVFHCGQRFFQKTKNGSGRT